MRYAVIGTGGIGAYYGARLAAAGHDVEFLFRSDHDHVKKHGLLIESCKGDIFLPEVKAFRSSCDMKTADVILVCTKTTSNDALPDILRPILGPESLIIMIQNGLGMEEKLAEALPGASIAGSTAFICSSRKAPGHISHTAYGELTFAPLSAGCEDRLEAAREDMEAAGVPCHMMDSVPLMRWKKLVWNIPYNGLSVVRDLKTDALTMEAENRALVIAMMEEVIGAAAACGVVIDHSFVDSMVAMTERMYPYHPSMYLDWKAGRKMEVDTMYGAPIAAAAAHGYDMKLAREVMEDLLKMS